ncbi:hypothetical protein AYI68_g1069 [Smittium mucronatum]|uniref:Peptidase S1 domain-containing protein n=1 Tax=Smittium mucronatum TaxID=133383 RepID=A0A1R0H6R1_9FUNG|nr:hypothetical protein AYI68_g1069 [Smittium mucronatum]
MAGYGLNLSTGKPQLHQSLQYMTATAIDPDSHDEYVYSKSLYFKSNNGYGTCSGDSGGPVVFEDGKTEPLVGLLSHGDHTKDGFCVTGGANNYYVVLYKYISWIEKNAILDRGRFVNIKPRVELK